MKSLPYTATKERDRKVFELAREFLLGLPEITEDRLGKYLVPHGTQHPKTVAGIYEKLLGAAQERQMGNNVIGAAVGGTHRLGVVLCGFEPQAVLSKYESWDAVLDAIVAQLRPRGQVRRTPRSLWPKFCETVLAGASFLVQFGTAEEFYRWVDFFDRDERARAALPMLLSYEVAGLGFALACMFLMELGYTQFGKPDVHLRTTFEALGLSRTDGDYDVFKAIVRMARHVGETPSAVDKLFWLIGSGVFYLDGKLRAGRNRDRFINYARERLRGD